MQITNISKNKVLAEDVVITDTLFTRIIGLINRREFKKSEALIIRPGNSIHTFFMRFPIDVLFLDNRNMIVYLKTCLKPGKIIPIIWRAKLVIELPAGTIAESQTAIGDKIIIE